LLKLNFIEDFPLMFGSFQQSQLRLEVPASASTIRESLLDTNKLSQWLFPQHLSPGLPEKLQSGTTFTSWLGFIAVQHQVLRASDNCLRLLLSQGIDGYHEWYWGEGWVQSSLAGISLLPLNLGQVATLWRLRQFLSR
jgi:hypothetical protein